MMPDAIMPGAGPAKVLSLRQQIAQAKALSIAGSPAQCRSAAAMEERVAGTIALEGPGPKPGPGPEGQNSWPSKAPYKTLIGPL